MYLAIPGCPDSLTGATLVVLVLLVLVRANCRNDPDNQEDVGGDAGAAVCSSGRVHAGRV
jgi:hypothetical protein